MTEILVEISVEISVEIDVFSAYCSAIVFERVLIG